MFTGIVEEIGKVKNITRCGSGARLEIVSDKVTNGIETGDSVSVNGVCLSALEAGGHLTFDVVCNTFSKTTLKRLKTGDNVNLENAMRLGDKVSGHMVTGHVDGERVIKNISNASKGPAIDIAIFSGDEKYLVQKGAVAVNGVSLTVGDICRDFFRVYLIPLTLRETTLGALKPGSYVNIEFDMMAKYAEKYNRGTITKDILRSTGFMS